MVIFQTSEGAWRSQRPLGRPAFSVLSSKGESNDGTTWQAPNILQKQLSVKNLVILTQDLDFVEAALDCLICTFESKVLTEYAK